MLTHPSETLVAEAVDAALAKVRKEHPKSLKRFHVLTGATNQVHGIFNPIYEIGPHPDAETADNAYEYAGFMAQPSSAFVTMKAADFDRLGALNLRGISGLSSHDFIVVCAEEKVSFEVCTEVMKELRDRGLIDESSDGPVRHRVSLTAA